jgi:DNA-directed RNA polymerase subunit RPC12/RpoP
MSHRDEYDEDDEADVGDHEEPDESDTDDDHPELIACPYCRGEISEEAEVCPHCGSYVLVEDVDRASRPWWVVAGMIACVVILVMWALGYVWGLRNV